MTLSTPKENADEQRSAEIENHRRLIAIPEGRDAQQKLMVLRAQILRDEREKREKGPQVE